MNLIERWIRPPDRFLDVGCGSGILMITAALQGVRHLHGIDQDDLAVTTAHKNLIGNGIPEDRFQLWRSDLTYDIKTRSYTFVAANMTAPPVMRLIELSGELMEKNGLFVASGILTEQCRDVTQKLSDHGFQILETEEEEGWVAILARR